ncbi:hypothetical protein WOLCODRAFT_107620 [Wolfiporia cocos MD-104 SS10]|uniref:Bromo domain-containing protein n=1 Tax=Wolfiporia cocos (strain MD-104) TaxID=742152 RepID=A0A2H3J790_WOLCO|nr:hypothetical protein WOLCODRAFT_107620 [Wolfiporia cocos MD-104 SS10]
MVTMDNKDAEAFLKPVSRIEVPDYYDVIAHPMDLQTMLKKVKQKQYKSKKEFKDDLDLIWNNCYQYNAAEVHPPASRQIPADHTQNHPLRQCATRLRAKAERLLANITDYKERADPVIPLDIALNGAAPRPNGVALNGAGHARVRSPAAAKSPSPAKAIPITPAQKRARRDAPFAESPAIVRTPAGMAAFAELDQELGWRLDHPGDKAQSSVEKKLAAFVPVADDEADEARYVDGGEVGAKRKLNGIVDDRPRKRARTHPPADRDSVELWWDAVQSDELLGNGLPVLAQRTSSPVPLPAPITEPPRRKKKRKADKPAANTLLYHINNNIRTMRRVRTTHAKFAALSQNQNADDSTGTVLPADLPTGLDDAEDVLDERPWKAIGSGIEVGEEHADDCIHWMSSKILEHAGFQGTSKVSLDILAGVASEFLLNVGRTMRFLCDKYAQKMTPEEIILHTLFESGTTRIYELERYIKDDVLRYGGRLADLEKKLASAYREATTEEAWDDDALFANADDEEEDGQFVMGNFADSFGEDFLGLRELGIAAEFGLTSLTIPKKLLKGKGKQGHAEGPSSVKPSEPPPPFPPPPPFVPLDPSSVENQIGLLKPYYQQRLSALEASAAPPSALPGAPLAAGSADVPVPVPPDLPPSLPLPDDAPSPSHTKTGPLGQILKGAPTAAAAKKKPKGKTPAAPLAMMPAPSEGELPPTEFAAPSPMTMTESPKKGRPSAGSPKKKAGKAPEAVPPVVAASA